MCRLRADKSADDALKSPAAAAAADDDGGGFSEHDETDCGIAEGFKSAADDDEDANLVLGKWPRDEADDQKLGVSMGGGVRA